MTEAATISLSATMQQLQKNQFWHKNNCSKNNTLHSNNSTARTLLVTAKTATWVQTTAAATK